MVRIEILAGPEAGRVVEFGSGTWRAGRLRENDLPLPVDSVSGRHLEFTVGGDGSVRFRDLGSTNGTFSGGAQVQEGEWFAGSELRLGGCALRLLAEGESSLLEEAAAEGRDAARAREAALTAKRSPLPWIGGAILALAAAGAGGWWFFLRDGTSEPTGRGAAVSADAPGVPQALDAIDGLGDFAEAEAWSLADSAALRDGGLVGEGPRARATLLRAFPLAGGGLALRAQVGGGTRVTAWVSFGEDEDFSAPLGAWCVGNLAVGAELALPPGTRWFKLSLQLDGPGRVAALGVDAIERAAAGADTPLGRASTDGGNLYVAAAGVPALCVAAAAGAWQRGEGGWTWSGSEGVLLTPGDGLIADGATWILADGGPVGASAGARVERSPGLLLGSEVRRVLVAHEPATWSAADGGLRSEDVAQFTLRWDLGEALTESARLAREIQTAEREGAEARVLAAAARLLRDYPLDEPRIQAARDAQRAALERGRERLARLKSATAGALFVGALDPMAALAAEAAELASVYAGTLLGGEAGELAGLLEGALAAGRDAARERDAAWRARLLAALAGAYPAMAAWVEERG